jgi:tetratricopeptide (TPR) repeat protein
MLYTPSHEAVDCDSKIDLNDGLLKCAEKLSTAISPYPMAAYFFQRRRWEEAKEQSLKVIRSQNPDERKWGYILYGQLCAQEQDWQTARNNYDAALGLDPKFAVAWVNLGNLELLGKSPDRKKAEDDYQTAMRFQPRDAIAASDLGDLMKTNGNPQEAEKFYKLAISIDPNLANAYSGLGSLAAKSGDVGSAKVWFGHAVQLSVSKANPYIQWGTVYLEQKQYGAAEVRFQWATSADKSNKLAWAALANTLELEGKYSEARQAILNALPDWSVPIAKTTKPGQMNPNLPAALLAADLVLRPYDFKEDAYCFDIYFLLERREKTTMHSSEGTKKSS